MVRMNGLLNAIGCPRIGCQKIGDPKIGCQKKIFPNCLSA
jgi:hypothetical protein